MHKNRMIRKAAALTLALMMILVCLTACGGDSSSEKQTLTIIDGNVKTEVEVKTGDKIADVLAQAGVTLGEKDTCAPDLNTEVAADTAQIVITRYTEATEPATTATEAATAAEEVKEEKVTEKIAYGTREEYSDALAEGDSEITRYGVEGEKEITYKVTYVDGKETAREKILEKITKEPVDEIITYGTASDDDGGVYEVSRENYPDCDGSGHGYYEILYSDGSTEYVEY